MAHHSSLATEDVQFLESRIFEEENALLHLIRSNDTLLALDPDLQDEDYRSAVHENKEVIERKKERIVGLRKTLAEAYGSSHTESKDTPIETSTLKPLVQPTGGPVAHTTLQNASSTAKTDFQPSGRKNGDDESSDQGADGSFVL